MPTNNITLPKLIEKFGGDESKCHAYLEVLRWPDGVECPRCQSKKISRIKKRRQFDCDDCHYHFSVRTGTILHDSHLPVWKWFLAVYMICQSKKGISSNHLKRMLGVSYKTAWYLTHRIRATMKDEDADLLNGIVEVDETFVGGKKKGVGRGRYHGKKVVVVGAAERGGEIRLKVISNRGRKALHEFIREHIADETREIHTDDWSPYRGIQDEHIKHRTVNHSIKQWVQGDVHTNTIEGVWSLLERSIVGSYHKLSTKHLPAYLDEMAFRYNNRKNPYMFRDTIRKLLSAPVLEYRQLTKTT